MVSFSFLVVFSSSYSLNLAWLFETIKLFTGKWRPNWDKTKKKRKNNEYARKKNQINSKGREVNRNNVWSLIQHVAVAAITTTATTNDYNLTSRRYSRTTDGTDIPQTTATNKNHVEKYSSTKNIHLNPRLLFGDLIKWLMVKLFRIFRCCTCSIETIFPS